MSITNEALVANFDVCFNISNALSFAFSIWRKHIGDADNLHDCAIIKETLLDTIVALNFVEEES